MKVLVMWENDTEREAAENLANVLAHLAPSLAADGHVHSDGGVTIHHGSGGKVPKVKTMASPDNMDFNDPFRPFGTPPETLAQEAQRLLAAQESAFGDHNIIHDPNFESTTFKVLGGQLVRKVVTGGLP